MVNRLMQKKKLLTPMQKYNEKMGRLAAAQFNREASKGWDEDPLT